MARKKIGKYLLLLKKRASSVEFSVKGNVVNSRISVTQVQYGVRTLYEMW